MWNVHLRAFVRRLVVIIAILNAAVMISCKKTTPQNPGSSVADVYGPIKSAGIDVKYSLLKEAAVKDEFIFETCDELVSEEKPYNNEQLLNCKVNKTSQKLAE